MRGLKRLRPTRVVSTGHAFIQNFAAVTTNPVSRSIPQHRLAAAFTELAKSAKSHIDSGPAFLQTAGHAVPGLTIPLCSLTTIVRGAHTAPISQGDQHRARLRRRTSDEAHYELGVDADPRHLLAAACTELALAI
jgi:hypothetical protein